MKFYFFCLLFFISVAVSAQYQIKGQVSDAATLRPVPYVSVQIEGTTLGSTSDSLGNFLISVSEKITTPFVLLVSCTGYTKGFSKVKDPVQPLQIYLQPEDRVLEEIIISAALKEEKRSESPLPVEIYSARFLQKNRFSNLFECLSQVNGVRPQITCNVCSTGDIRINGMAGPYSMVTIDGMPIVSGLSAVYGLSGIPQAMIERVEITRGPAASLYGSESMGGLINVVTKDLGKAPVMAFETFGSSDREWNADLAVKIGGKKINSLLGINYYQFDNKKDKNRDGFFDLTKQERVSVFNKWDILRKQDREASLAARFVYEDRWGGQLDFHPELRGSDSIYGESIFTHRLELIGKYQLPVAGERIFSQFSYVQHQQNSYYGNSFYLATQKVAFAQLFWDKKPWLFYEFLLGASLRYTFLNDNTPATQEMNIVWLPGIFLQNQWNFNTNNKLLMGVRYDYDSRHGSILTPRMSWKWQAGNRSTLRLSAGKGFRVANVFTEDHAALTGARRVVFTEALKPEVSYNTNLNFVKEFETSLGEFSLDATLFYTHFSNQILPDYDSDPELIIYSNLEGYAVSRGLSLNLDLDLKNSLQINAGITWLDAFFTQKNEWEDWERQTQLYAPAFSANYALSYRIDKWRLSLDFTGSVNGPMRLPVFPNDPRPAYSPWYALQNVQMTKKLTLGIELYVACKNVFNFFPREEVLLRAFDPFDKLIEQDNPGNFTFDTAYNYAPLRGRLFQLGLRWQLR